MTMNWYVAESLIAERSQSLVRAEGRRWPDLDHARRVRAAPAIRPDVVRGIPARRRLALPAAAPGHRFLRFVHGLVAGRPLAQR